MPRRAPKPIPVQNPVLNIDLIRNEAAASEARAELLRQSLAIVESLTTSSVKAHHQEQTSEFPVFYVRFMCNGREVDVTIRWDIILRSEFPMKVVTSVTGTGSTNDLESARHFQAALNAAVKYAESMEPLMVAYLTAHATTCAEQQAQASSQKATSAQSAPTGTLPR